jgi:hypothetical protein
VSSSSGPRVGRSQIRRHLGPAADVDSTMTLQPQTTVGFRNTVLQRTIDAVSVGSNEIRSTLTVQINESGEYRVNSWVIQ